MGDKMTNTTKLFLKIRELKMLDESLIVTDSMTECDILAYYQKCQDKKRIEKEIKDLKRELNKIYSV